MTKRTSASSVQITLFVGSFFSGVATALVLVQFDTIPEAWKISLTVAVAIIGIVLLITSLAIQLLRLGSHTQIQNSARFSVPRPAGATPKPTTGSMDSGLREDGGDREAQCDSARVYESHGPSVEPLSHGGLADGGTSPQDSGSSEETKQEPSASVESTPGMASAPKALVEVQPADLVAAWDTYRRNGDGHFNSRGLQGVLDELGIEATVNGGDPIGLGRSVLIVETPFRQGYFYVLPSFATSPREVADWFEDSSSGALTGRTERVISVAEGHHTPTGPKVIKQGVVA